MWDTGFHQKTRRTYGRPRAYEEEPVREEVNYRRVIGLLAGVFLVILTVVIGVRLSSDAIAVLVGVIAGVAASVPTALLIAALTRRREVEYDQGYNREPRQAQPPVIVVAPGSAPQVLPQYPGAYPNQLPPARGQRNFRVMGFDEEDMEMLDEPGEGGAKSW